MGWCLIVANQTLGGDALARAVEERIERGHSRFYIVVPKTAPKEETDAWSRGFSAGEFGVVEAPRVSMPAADRERLAEKARRRQAMLDEARRRAERRLGQMIHRIRSAGGEADGTVSDPDPAVAVEELLRDESFDELIVSTLPTGLSRWMEHDLPSRISRMTDLPVTAIEAEAEAEG